MHHGMYMGNSSCWSHDSPPSPPSLFLPVILLQECTAVGWPGRCVLPISFSYYISLPTFLCSSCPSWSPFFLALPALMSSFSGRRSGDDEALIQIARECAPDSSILAIFDARSFMAAEGNKLMVGEGVREERRCEEIKEKNGWESEGADTLPYINTQS